MANLSLFDRPSLHCIMLYLKYLTVVWPLTDIAAVCSLLATFHWSELCMILTKLMFIASIYIDVLLKDNN